MRVHDQRPPAPPRFNPYGNELKRHNDARKRGEKALDVLPISSAKPTLPKLKFLENAEND